MTIWFAVAAAVALIILLALVHVPLGGYMARVYESPRHTRIEKLTYRIIRVDEDSEQSASAYTVSVIAFSLVGVLVLYAILRLQDLLPYSSGLGAVDPFIAFNTAISFVTNTDWQAYSPEATLGLGVQALGLAVQNFVSAAVGLAVAIALVRGLARRRSGTIGNFWVDLVRGTYRILLPLSLVTAVVLIAGGVIQNFSAGDTITTLAGGTQNLPGGLVASQEAIKELGTNGGGFFNANSAHPFENPNAWTNLFEIFLMLAIPFSLPRTFGVMVGDKRQGHAILATMGTLYVASFALMSWFEASGAGTATTAAGAAMEGKEDRFGIFGSTLFATSSTLTSTGSVNSMHDSYTPLGGMMAMLNMMLGEIAPGGVGAGLYGILILAIVAVFIGGLMVGRTPEYLGKKIGPREMKLASLYILVTPALILIGTGVSFAIPAVSDELQNVSMTNSGAHGFSEVLYAFTSAANNNGSAFGGLTASTPWLTVVLGIIMLLGRFLPIVLVLTLAGSLAAQDKRPETVGTLPTYRPQFVALLLGTTIIIVALTYFPVIALGPLAEAL